MKNTQKPDLHVVLGATGALGSNLVDELLYQKKKVVAVVRNLAKAHQRFNHPELIIRKADLLQKEDVISAISGGSIVYHCGGLPYKDWMKYYPVMNSNILEAVRKEGAVLVYADNLYMYGRMQHEQIAENHPISHKSKKGSLRYYLAAQILEAHKNGSLRAVIVRAGDYYGPFVKNGFAEPLFQNPLIGKPVSWIGNADQPHSLIYIKDLTKAVVMIAENEDTYGQIWHIPGDNAFTGREYAEQIGSALGTKVKIKVLTPFMLNILSPFVPILRELKDLSFEWVNPFIIDGTKFSRQFPGYIPTTHAEAFRETLDWFNAHLSV
jgi:nucleoside-diphosphate-sugar epimerase